APHNLSYIKLKVLYNNHNVSFSNNQHIKPFPYNNPLLFSYNRPLNEFISIKALSNLSLTLSSHNKLLLYNLLKQGLQFLSRKLLKSWQTADLQKHDPEKKRR